MKPSASVDPGAARRLFSVLSAVWDTDRWRLELWDGSGAGSRDTGVRPPFSQPQGLDRLVGDLRTGALAGPTPRAASRSRAFTPSWGGSTISRCAGWLDCCRASSPPRWRWEPGPTPAGSGGGASARTAPQPRPRQRGDPPPLRPAPEFYRLFLGRTLTYSCAYFETPETDLDTAQEAKLELVCRKLRLHTGERFLDIGCGWGSLVFHAAQHWGVRALGITASPRQAPGQPSRCGHWGWREAEVSACRLPGRPRRRVRRHRQRGDGRARGTRGHGGLL